MLRSWNFLSFSAMSTIKYMYRYEYMYEYEYMIVCSGSEPIYQYMYHTTLGPPLPHDLQRPTSR